MLSAADIRRHFELLDAELRTEGILGELYLVGGAVMCLVFNARPSTNDVDAYLVPSRALREAAMRVGAATGAGSKWLNDAVKGFLSQHGDFDPFLDLPNLKVFTARAEYLFAMKCVALRVGAEFHDVDDVRYLIRHLGISELTEAFAIVERYYPPDRIPPKTRFALEELLGDRPTSRAIRLDLE